MVESRGAPYFGAFVVLLVPVLISRQTLWRPDRTFGPEHNVQIAEAQAWWNGRLDLPERKWDTAFVNGRVYSYFPPMFTLLATLIVPFADGVPHWVMVGLSGLVPLLSYRLFLRLARSVPWAVVLSVGFVCGTSVWPVLASTLQYGTPYLVNHTLSTIGLLVMLIELCGRRRLWVLGLGFAITILSRQMTGCYALVVLSCAWLGRCAEDCEHPAGARGRDAGSREGTEPRRWRRLAWGVLLCLVPVMVYMSLNTAKFGHPFHTGYMANHENRDDVFAREARAFGLLSVHWIPRNFYYSNIGLPRLHTIEIEGRRQSYLRHNMMGTGIWWTSPVLLWIWFHWRERCRDPIRVSLLISAAGVYGLLLLWHATGAEQRGFNRYSVDYLPAVFALIVPSCLMGWRRWLTLAMIASGVAYYCVVLPIPHVRIW